MATIIVSLLGLQVSWVKVEVEEGSLVEVSGGIDEDDEGTKESMAEINPKVVNQYFIWFAHCLKFKPVNLSDLIFFGMIRVNH